MPRRSNTTTISFPQSGALARLREESDDRTFSLNLEEVAKRYERFMIASWPSLKNQEWAALMIAHWSHPLYEDPQSNLLYDRVENSDLAVLNLTEADRTALVEKLQQLDALEHIATVYLLRDWLRKDKTRLEDHRNVSLSVIRTKVAEKMPPRKW